MKCIMTLIFIIHSSRIILWMKTFAINKKYSIAGYVLSVYTMVALPINKPFNTRVKYIACCFRFRISTIPSITDILHSFDAILQNVTKIHARNPNLFNKFQHYIFINRSTKGGIQVKNYWQVTLQLSIS